MAQEPGGPWLRFFVQGTEGLGVDLSKVAQLLEDLSSAFYAIAREKVGLGGTRPGPRKRAEDELAGIRLVRVEPGSATIELAPPLAPGVQGLVTLEEPVPDDVAVEFLEEVNFIGGGDPPREGRYDIRKRVRAVVDDVGEIGSRAEIELRPHIPERYQDVALKVSFDVTNLMAEEPVRPFSRRRHLSGHAYMVDIERGRQRLRIKLPDARDVTLDVEEGLISRIRAALDHVVELEVDEEIDGETISSRLVRGVSILPSSGPDSDLPPKSIEELEREQDLPKQRPDYVALASAVWESEEEVADFEVHLLEMRHAEIT